MRLPLHIRCLAALFGVFALPTLSLAQDRAPILPDIPDHPYPVANYGALGDDKTPSSQGIQMAIDACVQSGGGRVEVPPGTYRMPKPIRLASKVNLHLEAGATLVFTRNFDAYPLTITHYDGIHTVQHQSPISAVDCKNVAITGAGVIDGNGDAWRLVRKSSVSEEQWQKFIHSGGVTADNPPTWWPSRSAMEGFAGLAALRHGSKESVEPRIEDYEQYKDLLRPQLVMFENCQRILLDGPTFRHSPTWTIHTYGCDELTVRHITVDNEDYGANTDGIDIDSCRNVLVTDSAFNCGDDDIVLKSGRDEYGRREARPTENVVITNCTVGYGHGGIAIGSETSGGIRNVHISHCKMTGTDAGFRVKTTRGRGGVIEDVTATDLEMSGMLQYGIDISMFYAVRQPPTTQPVDETTPRVRRLRLSNIKSDGGRFAMQIRGLPEMPVEDVTFDQVDLSAQRAGQISNVKNLTLKNVQVRPASGPPVSVENATGLNMEQVTGIAQ